MWFGLPQRDLLSTDRFKPEFVVEVEDDGGSYCASATAFWESACQRIESLPTASATGWRATWAQKRSPTLSRIKLVSSRCGTRCPLSVGLTRNPSSWCGYTRPKPFGDKSERSPKRIMPLPRNATPEVAKSGRHSALDGKLVHYVCDRGPQAGATRKCRV